MEPKQSSPTLYQVKVKKGGTFIYDLIDVGRFALRMHEAGDNRTFTVKPLSRWQRFRDRLSS